MSGQKGKQTYYPCDDEDLSPERTYTQRFATLKSAKEHFASLAEASTSDTQDEGEVEEKKNDTSTSGVLSTLQDVHDTIPLPFASSSMSGSSSDNKRGKRAAASQSGKEKKKAKISSSTSGEGRDVFRFGDGSNPTQRSRQMEPSSNSDEQHMIENRPFQSSSGELFRLMGSLFKSQIPKDLVEEAEKRSDGTINSFLASLEILMQEFTKVGSSKKASPAIAVDPSPVEVSNSFDALNVDAQPARSSVSTPKKKNKSKAMVAAEATVQKTMEETMKEESKLERKHRLLATERERLQKIEVEKMQKRSEEKARKEKEMEDSPAEESIEDNPFEEADEAVKAADVDSAEVSPKSSCIADMSNPSSVVKDTPVVDSEGRTPVEEGKITESSSPDDSKSSPIDLDVLSPTISKVSSEESTSIEEQSTFSQVEVLKAEMAAMEAKIKEQKMIISRYESSDEFVNQLSTSGKKFDAHLSDKGEGFDAYLSAQGEKLAALLDDNQKDSDGDTVMEVSDGSTPSATSSRETVTTDTEVSSGSIPSSLSSSSSASSAGEGQADSVILLGDDLLADIEVDDFRIQILDNLRCLLENKSIHIQQLGVRQDDNECTVISVLTAIIHAHSADGRVSNEVFRSVITTLGIAVANKVRHLGSQSQFSYLDLESVKQFLQSFLDDVTTLETSETDMFISTVRKDFLSQLVSDKRVAQVFLSNGHTCTLTNREDGKFDLLDSLICPNMGLNSAFRITCNTLDDLEVALLSLLSSRMGSNNMQSRVFQALTISSSASTTPLSAQDLTGRISHLVGGFTSQSSPGSDVGSVPNEAAKKIEFQDLVKQAEDAYGLDALESYSKAADLCTLALSIYSDNKEALILRVRANMRLKKWESVISDTTIILSMDDNNIKMIYSRGNASMRMGKYQEALTDFNVALTLTPSEPEMDMLNRNIAICTKHLPVSIDVSDDLKMYETIEEDDSPTPTNDMIECMMAMEEEEYDEVVRIASDIISTDPTSKWFHIRGLAHQVLGNYKDALNDYMDADSLDPTDEIRTVLNARGKECVEKLKDFNLFKMISDSTVPPESLKDFSKNDILKARRFFEHDNLENLAKTTLGNISRFIPVTTNSASTNYTRCGVVGSFPVTGQHAEEYGPLHGRGRNVIPQGPTPFEFFRAMRVLLMQHHGISSELANIIAMHSFVWLDFVPFTLDKKASTEGVDHENYETLKNGCEGAVVKYISDVVAQLHLTHIVVIGRHAKEFVEKHRDKLFSSEVKVYYCLHPSKMSMGASNHEVFDTLTTMNKMIYDLRGEECKPINIEFMENNFQTYIRDNVCGTGGSDEYVYVGERDGVPVLYERSRTAFERLLSDKDAFHSHIPNQATIQSNMEEGTPTHFAGLDIKIYKFDSKDAPSLEFGAQTGTSQYEEWFKCPEKCLYPMVYVARYGPKKVITHYATGHVEMKDMIRKDGGTFRDENFPTRADFESGNVKEVAGLRIEMYRSDSDEAVKFRDMEPGAQTDTDEFKEWEEKVKSPQIYAHAVDLDTLSVVSVIGNAVSTIIGLNNCGNIDITKNIASEVNGELEKIGLKIESGGSTKPGWDNWEEAMKSIEKGLSVLIYLRIENQVPGAHVVKCNRRKDSYHLPFILAGVQLDPGKEATVECEAVGVPALDENDFKTEAAKLKVLPKNKRIDLGRGNKCCKIDGCVKQGKKAKDHMCAGHYNLFQKADRDTTEGDG